MEIVNVGASCVAITWVLAELIAKLLLKTLDKRVVAVIAGVLTAVGAKIVVGLGVVDTVGLAAGLPIVAGVLTDKIINPLLMKGK